MYRAATIAQWFINRTALDVDSGGDYITNLKLQKLLYYAQGTYLALKEQKLFSDKIKKWNYGPVVTAVYEKYKEYRNNGIDKTGKADIDEETTDILQEVYNVFGQYTAFKLSQMTHEEDPWQNAEHNGEISAESIKEYFEKHYIG